jgi:hypothetical protein
LDGGVEVNFGEGGVPYFIAAVVSIDIFDDDGDFDNDVIVAVGNGLDRGEGGINPSPEVVIGEV